MEPVLTRIPARSRRQAMDWSLVLVSQGIETTIDHGPDGWGLWMDPKDSERAFKTLRQYRVENRGWPWPERLKLVGAHFDWSCLAWAALLIAFHVLSQLVPVVAERGVMNSSAVLGGQWWRIFTAMMLHADNAHLAANLSIGILLLGLAMGRYGAGVGLLAAWLAGAVGNVASLCLNVKPFDGLGASGMVMGALGLLSAQTLQRGPWNRGSLTRTLSGVAAGIMLFALYGVAPGSDIIAHTGGFAAGLLLGAALVFAPEKLAGNRHFNLASGWLLTAIVILTWALALGAKN